MDHYLYLHIRISVVKQTSDRRHEHSEERNANKRVCLVHSIQKNKPSTMSDDHLAITLVNFSREKYLLAE